MPGRGSLLRSAPWFVLALLCHAPLGWFARGAALPAFDAAPSAAQRPDALPVEASVDLEQPAPEPSASSSEPSQAVAGAAEAAPRRHRRRAKRSPPPIPVVAPIAAAAPRDSIADPLARLSGQSAVEHSPPLRLLLHIDRLRAQGERGERALSAAVGALLAGIPAYRELFAPGALDPMRDMDRLLLLAGRLGEASSLSSVFAYNVPRYRVRQAFTEPSGYALPAARTLVIGPTSGPPLLRGIARGFRLPAPHARELAALHVARPARTLGALGWAVPESLRWLRVELALADDGSALATLLARDASAGAAADSARALTHSLGAKVEAERDTLRAELRLDAARLQAVLAELADVLN